LKKKDVKLHRGVRDGGFRPLGIAVSPD